MIERRIYRAEWLDGKKGEGVKALGKSRHYIGDAATEV